MEKEHKLKQTTALVWAYSNMTAHFMCIHGVQATPTTIFLLEIPRRKADPGSGEEAKSQGQSSKAKL